MKTILGALGAGIIAAALLAGPAQARCLSSSNAWECTHVRHSEVRKDRNRLQDQRAEVRHDRRHVRHLQARLHRDMYVGSSIAVARDRHALRHSRRELRADRRDTRHMRRELNRDRLGE